MLYVYVCQIALLPLLYCAVCVAASPSGHEVVLPDRDKLLLLPNAVPLHGREEKGGKTQPFQSRLYQLCPQCGFTAFYY